MTMADKIKRSNQAPSDSIKNTRQKASEKEHRTTRLPTSFKFPSETLSQLQELQLAWGQQKGRPISATEVLRTMIDTEHKKLR